LANTTQNGTPPRAVRTASVTIDAAPLPEPALPAHSLVPAITGARCSVQFVVISVDKPCAATRSLCSISSARCARNTEGSCSVWP
jgi:hypothetical protein